MFENVLIFCSELLLLAPRSYPVMFSTLFVCLSFGFLRKSCEILFFGKTALKTSIVLYISKLSLNIHSELAEIRDFIKSDKFV